MLTGSKLKIRSNRRLKFETYLFENKTVYDIIKYKTNYLYFMGDYKVIN